MIAISALLALSVAAIGERARVGTGQVFDALGLRGQLPDGSKLHMLFARLDIDTLDRLLRL